MHWVSSAPTWGWCGEGNGLTFGVWGRMSQGALPPLGCPRWERARCPTLQDLGGGFRSATLGNPDSSALSCPWARSQLLKMLKPRPSKWHWEPCAEAGVGGSVQVGNHSTAEKRCPREPARADGPAPGVRGGCPQPRLWSWRGAQWHWDSPADLSLSPAPPLPGRSLEEKPELLQDGGFRLLPRVPVPFW